MTNKRPHLSTRFGALAALLLFTLTLPALAYAAGGKRVGVPKFEGAQEALVRKQVMKVLKAHGYELVKSRQIETAMSNTGALLESDDGFQKISKELALMAVVTGEVGKKRAKIIVHDGREGSVLGEASFPGANPKKIAAEVAHGFWSKLGTDIGRGHVPSNAKKPTAPVAEAPEDDESTPEAGESEGAAPEPSKSKETVAAGEGESAAGGEGEQPKKKKKKKDAKSEGDAGGEEDASAGIVPPIFDGWLGMFGINRDFSYNQQISQLREYSLPAGPAVAAHIVAYPLNYVFDGPLQHLGIVLGIEQAFGVNSSIDPKELNPDGSMSPLAGKTYGTSVHEYAAGLRYRIPFGFDQIWIEASGGEHAFVFKSPAMCDAATNCRPKLDIPDTVYQYGRAGAGARFEIGDFALSVSAGYRVIFNGAGNHIETYFPHSSVGGLDAQAYVGYRITPNIELRGGLELRRYFYAMNSQYGVDDTAEAMAAKVRIAGGAIDQYISFGGGVAFLLGGSDRPEGGAASAEEEAPKKKKKKKSGDEGGEEATPEGE